MMSLKIRFVIEADNTELVVQLLKQCNLSRLDFEDLCQFAAASKKFDFIPLLLDHSPQFILSFNDTVLHQILSADRFDIVKMILNKNAGNFSVLNSLLELFLCTRGFYGRDFPKIRELYDLSNREFQMLRKLMQTLYLPTKMDKLISGINIQRLGTVSVRTNFYSCLLFSHFNYDLGISSTILSRSKKRLHLLMYKDNLTELGIGLQSLQLPRLLLCFLIQFCSSPFVAEISDTWNLLGNIKK